MKSKLFLIPILLWTTTLLTACTTQEVITEYVYVETKTKVPSTLLAHCNPTKPPSIDRYMKASLQERETILIQYSKSLLNDIAKCNVKIDSVKNLINHEG